MGTLRHHFFHELGLRPVFITETADANGVNLFTRAGSPSGAVNLVYTINSGVWVGSTTPATPALTVSGFNAGSRIVIQVLGSCVGAGGPGNSGAGGDAISLGNNVEIDNTYGLIGGGGGGGSQGSAEGSGIASGDGGGGGGGQGSTGGSAGVNSVAGGATGGTATAGSRTAPGVGAAGGSETFYGKYGGAGGDGGSLGNAGDRAGVALPSHTGGLTPGAAGFAIRKNGKTVTFTGGNNSTQVLGSVA